MLVESLALAAGLVILVLGADWLVKGAVAISESFGVSQFVIGLTLVSVGTSLPELAASVAAVVEGDGAFVLGNVVGSNIANIGLIVGLGAAVSVMKAKEGMDERDGYVMVLSMGLLLLFMLDGVLVRWEATALLISFGAYVFYLAMERPRIRHLVDFGGRVPGFFSVRTVFEARAAFRGMVTKAFDYTRELPRKRVSPGMAVSVLRVVGGLAAVIIGADLLVWGVSGISAGLGIGSMFIGATVVAFGTSLPELSVTISAARKNHGDLALGNVLGSNIVNVLLVAGVSGVISPLTGSLISSYFAIPLAFFMSILLVVFLRTSNTVTRLEGYMLLGIYVLFIAGMSLAQA